MKTKNLPGITVKAEDTPEDTYHPSFTRSFDLVNTKLDVTFDYTKQRMNGKATITLHPHFYPSNTLNLNARGMLLHKVTVLQKNDTVPQVYEYKNDTLKILFDRIYKKNETLAVYIEYTACPEELKTIKDGHAITSDKGLYFINALKKETKKPRQIWTQGETQSNSVWFPTIDAPNQKMTQEIRMTVDTTDVTLSNGRMISSISNGDGTRSDTWKQDLPHAPYLAMMAIGPFAVIKDSWKGKEVNYYVEPEYKNVARKIFGNTPEMLDYFSEQLGVEFAWDKYSQAVVREFVSGAMENTTATVHMEALQRNERELLDYTFEEYISHELFHQWFGDLVTCESWSNIPLNESFATYGEYLWNDHKYGREAADYAHLHDLSSYLREARTKQVPMIRYYYAAADELYDRHSYEKGGLILHMLRNYLGDDAFFSGLNYYLTQHRFKTTELADLRLAFEEVSGRDLNWFFDQWFFKKGHPILDIAYNWNANTKSISITISQIQDTATTPVYQLPIAIDLYTSAGASREQIIITSQKQVFTFPVKEKPLLINVDANKILLGQKTDHHNSTEWMYQYYHAPLFADRFEAVKGMPDDYSAGSLEAKVLMDAMNDKFWYIRQSAINKLSKVANADSVVTKKKLVQLATTDPKSSVRAAALLKLSSTFQDDFLNSVYKQQLNDSSYLVMHAAMECLASSDPLLAVSMGNQFEKEDHAEVRDMLTTLYGEYGNASNSEYMKKVLSRSEGDELYGIIGSYSSFLKRMNDENILNDGIDSLGKKGVTAEPWYVRFAAMQALNDLQVEFSKQKSIAERANIKEEIAKLNRLQQRLIEQIQNIRNAEKDASLKALYLKKSE